MLRVLKGFIFKRFVIPILGMCVSFLLVTKYYICIDDVLKKINSGKIIEIQSKVKIMLPIKGSDHYFISESQNYSYNYRDTDLVEIDKKSFFDEKTVYNVVIGKGIFGETAFFVDSGGYIENYYFRERNIVFGLWIFLLMIIYTIWIGFRVRSH